jgi:hypothetical protein
MGEHPALKNLYGQVVSGSFNWDRWGLLGTLSDCVLNYVQGDLLEIGCGESSIYFSKLAEKYNRTCYHVEYSISGVHNMTHTDGYFGKNSKVFNMKSDDFFEQDKLGKSKIALAFIDGDHDYEVINRDFWNTVEHMVPEGFIFFHDSLPPDKTWMVDHKCGTVYRLRNELESLEALEVFTFPFSAFNVGLTMVRKRKDRSWEFDDGS